MQTTPLNKTKKIQRPNKQINTPLHTHARTQACVTLVMMCFFSSSWCSCCRSGWLRRRIWEVAPSRALSGDVRRNVAVGRAGAKPHLSGCVLPEEGGPATGEEAGSAPFSPPVLKSLGKPQESGLRVVRWCTCLGEEKRAPRIQLRITMRR